MKLTAKWIWNKQPDYNKYNQTIIAKRTFRLSLPNKAFIRITADSYYRLYINQQWVCDGPCRSWPNHYQYDKIDVTSYLTSGNNEVKVIARHFGTGDFHRRCQQAGLLAQLDVKLSNGKTKTIITDQNWQTAKAKAWLENTPKISIQMRPAEYYNAAKEKLSRFSKAQVLFDANKGPWKNLKPRDVALLTKKPFSFKSFTGAKIVKKKQPELLRTCNPTIAPRPDRSQ